MDLSVSSTQLVDPDPQSGIVESVTSQSRELADDITSDCEVLEVTVATAVYAEYAECAKTAAQRNGVVVQHVLASVTSPERAKRPREGGPQGCRFIKRGRSGKKTGTPNSPLAPP